MMQRGDILIAVDENPVTGLSHSDVILFMSNAARNGVVKLTLRRENDITRTNSNSTCKLEIIRTLSDQKVTHFGINKIPEKCVTFW